MVLKLRFTNFYVLSIPNVHFTFDAETLGREVLMEEFRHHGDTAQLSSLAGLHQPDIKGFAFPIPCVFEGLSSSFSGQTIGKGADRLKDRYAARR